MFSSENQIISKYPHTSTHLTHPHTLTYTHLHTLIYILIYIYIYLYIFQDAMLREYQDEIKMLKQQLEATQRGVRIDEDGRVSYLLHGYR